ncbi:MAG: M20/M25/M40 family metallo-hydrolase, partial [Phycisphaeraceae bacterium]|nr:M20/M25/M40 family metallo-hydrolase [Phycisphaeraceae bacterium]
MLSKTTILDWITAHEPDLLQFTRDLVATPSVNPPGDERAVAERIDDELGKLGLGKAQIIAAEPHRPNILHRVAATAPGPTLVFCGHMDTKPAGNRQQWKHDPLDPVVDGDKLYGLGSSDMKSGIAATVYAVAALQATGSLQAGQLHLLFTADEEAGSHLGSKFLAANGHVQGDAILISESCGV